MIKIATFAGALLLFLLVTDVVFAQPKVGIILPLSGEFAIPGEACRKGIQMAASELAEKGLTVELLVEDSPGASTKSTLTAYQRLKNLEQVSIFIGFVSPEELSVVGPLADKDGSALVGFVASKNRPRNSLLVWMSPQVEAARLAAEVFKHKKKVAILSGDQEWETSVSDAFAEEFEKLGGKTVLRIDSPFSNKDVTSSVLKLKATKAEAVIIPPYSLFSAYTRALRKLGIKIPIYTVEIDQSAVNEAAGSAEGAIIIRPVDKDNVFKEKFTKYFKGTLPDMPASQCYDAMNIVGQGIRAGSKNGAELAMYFRSLNEYLGASGQIEFKGNHTIFDTEFMQVLGGKIVPHQKTP